MEKLKIEMTEDEMIKYYANKIVEDGIKDTFEFSNVIDIKDYGDDIAKFKYVILERIYRDERVADVNLDEDGNFDMVFYTDYCPYYCDFDLIEKNEYNSLLNKNLLEDFMGYYSNVCLFDNPYISIRNVLNSLAERHSDNQETREIIKNMIKKILIESNFIENNIDGIEVYVTPDNYKELEKVFEEYIQNVEEQELE